MDGSNRSNQRNITKKPTRQNQNIAIYEALAGSNELGTTYKINPASGKSGTQRKHSYAHF